MRAWRSSPASSARSTERPLRRPAQRQRHTPAGRPQPTDSCASFSWTPSPRVSSVRQSPIHSHRQASPARLAIRVIFCTAPAVLPASRPVDRPDSPTPRLRNAQLTSTRIKTLARPPTNHQRLPPRYHAPSAARLQQQQQQQQHCRRVARLSEGPPFLSHTTYKPRPIPPPRASRRFVSVIRSRVTTTPQWPRRRQTSSASITASAGRLARVPLALFSRAPTCSTTSRLPSNS